MTRSTSNDNVNLSNIKLLIENSEAKIVSTLKSDLSKISELLQSLTRRVEEVVTKNVCLEKRFDTLEKDNLIISTELSNLKNSCIVLKSEFNQMFEASANESLNRMKRLHNLVIQGVPEIATGSLDDRIRHDFGSVEWVRGERTARIV